jgi:hypothetical protein
MKTEIEQPTIYTTDDVLRYVGEQLSIYQTGEWGNRLTEIYSVLNALGQSGVRLDAQQYEQVKRLVNQCVDNPEIIVSLLNYINSFSE